MPQRIDQCLAKKVDARARILRHGDVMSLGMCHLASIPVRRAPDLCSEMVNQLLFGETFRVIKKHDHYRLIHSDHDAYEGWIDGRQSLAIDEVPVRVEPVIALESRVSDGVSIIQGSTLPEFENGVFRCGDKACRYDGLTSACLEKTSEAMLDYAKGYLGSPYLWGGRSPFGIDCSGFVQVVYRAFGKSLPRDASQQISEGASVPSLADVRAGDLVFLRSGYDGSPHVGLALGNGQIIHASAQVRIDTLDEKGIFNEETQGYSHDLRELRRVFP